MIIEGIELRLALLLIQKHSMCENAYGLTKILSRKFDIIDSAKLIKSLVAEGFITYEKINGLEHFTVTFLGDNFLNQYLPEKLYVELINGSATR